MGFRMRRRLDAAAGLAPVVLSDDTRNEFDAACASPCSCQLLRLGMLDGKAYRTMIDDRLQALGFETSTAGIYADARSLYFLTRMS